MDTPWPLMSPSEACVYVSAGGEEIPAEPSACAPAVPGGENGLLARSPGAEANVDIDEFVLCMQSPEEAYIYMCTALKGLPPHTYI